MSKIKLALGLTAIILLVVGINAYAQTITTSTTNTSTVSGANGTGGANASSGVNASHGSNGSDGYYVDTGSSIPTLTNSGTINGGNGGSGGAGFATGDSPHGGNGGSGGAGIYIKGTITTIVNTGTMSGGIGGAGGLSASGGTLGSNGHDGNGISITGTAGTVTTLTNAVTGSIFGGVWVGGDNFGINEPTISTLNNFGVISGGINVAMSTLTPGANPSITAINNTGAINDGIYIAFLESTYLRPAISSIINSGYVNGGVALLGSHQTGLGAGSLISSFINEGAITGGIDISLLDAALGGSLDGITTLTNFGSISGVISVTSITGNAVGIHTLNNQQGSSNSALAYNGVLPTNYNVIINSAANYGQLSGSSLSGSTTFGVYSGSNVTSRLYTGVLRGLASSNVAGSGSTRTGSYDGMTWTLTETVSTVGSENWDLTFSGISTVQTQSSLHTLASRLRGAFSSQAVATNFANMNTYDCDLFDDKGICVSVGGQQTYVDNPSSNLTSTVVVAGYKVSPTLRIGGFLNQNINNNTVAGVHISNAKPLMGLFAVWNQNEDHLGYQVKVANAYQDKDVSTIRDAVATSEPGRGSTELNTQSYVGELSYAFLANEDKTLVRPYAAVRYTRIKQDGYTEETSSAVTAPLTYASLSDRSTAALVGVKLNHKLADKVTLTASLGVEQDLNHDVDNLTASGVSGLTSENFNNNINRTRPVASIGAYYRPVKNQRIAADIYYQELPFQSTASTTAYVNYMIGF